jgi:hypothetical protein
MQTIAGLLFLDVDFILIVPMMLMNLLVGVTALNVSHYKVSERKINKFCEDLPFLAKWAFRLIVTGSAYDYLLNARELPGCQIYMIIVSSFILLLFFVINVISLASGISTYNIAYILNSLGQLSIMSFGIYYSIKTSRKVLLKKPY